AYGQTGMVWNASSGAIRETPVDLLGLYFGLLLAALPIFTTGEWEAPGAEGGERTGAKAGASPAMLFLRRMVPDSMLRAELPAGAPLMGLWTLIAAAIVVGGFFAMGKGIPFPLDILPLFLTIAAVLAAFTGLGNFLSVAFQDRKATMVLT